MSQVIKKRRIVLTSVLKPVDDTRMLEKIGASLADSGLFEVTIIAYPSIGTPSYPGIAFIALPAFARSSFKRLLIPWIIFKKIYQVKPEIIVINTAELLFAAVLNRILFGRKIVYDVLENYYQNIRYTPTYPSLIRLMLAVSVRAIESLTAPFVHQFLLAEKGYKKELPFARKPVVLQNKLPKTVAVKYATNRKGNSKLIFSGTLAESSGVFEAIKLAKGLHEIDKSYSLTIIGYCAVPSVLRMIHNEIKDFRFIHLIGGDVLVPHNQILNELNKADLGIIIYPKNQSTSSSIPTKLFEYLALQLPILIHHNQESHRIVEECNAGIILDSPYNPRSLSEKIKVQRIQPTIPDTVYWDSEAENLINCLKIL